MKLTGIIMAHVKMKCPLCKEYYRTKFLLMSHVNKEHSESEAERFIKKQS